MRRCALHRFLYPTILALPTAVRASTTGLPWEGPLTTLKDSLTGPVAMVISLLGVLVCGALLIFNKQELGEFAKMMILFVLITSGFFLGTSILTVLFGFSAAVL